MPRALVYIDGRSLDELGVEPLLRRIKIVHTRRLASTLALELINVGNRFGRSKTFHEGAVIIVRLQSREEMISVGQFDLARIQYRYGSVSRLVLFGMGPEFQLAREPRRRTFQRMSDSDIATRIANEQGLSTDVTATQPAFEQVSQIDVSDLQLLYERAQRYGFDVYVQNQTLHFHALRAPEETFVYEAGSELVVKVDLDEILVGVGTQWELTGRDPMRNQPFRVTQGPEPQIGEDVSREDLLGRLTRFVGGTRLDSSQEGLQKVQALAQDAAPLIGGSLTVVGQPAMRPRHRVTLDDFEVMSGDYLVEEVQHEYLPGAPKSPFLTTAGLSREVVGRRKVVPTLEEEAPSSREVPFAPAENLVPAMEVESTVTE